MGLPVEHAPALNPARKDARLLRGGARGELAADRLGCELQIGSFPVAGRSEPCQTRVSRMTLTGLPNAVTHRHSP
jgi:hypothetical protein